MDEAAARLGVLDGVALVAGGWAGGTRLRRGARRRVGRACWRTNLDTVAHVCRAALPHLRKQGGSVVAVGSRAAETGGAGMAAYAVSKVAVHALVRVLALENRGRGVRFNAVLPGTIDTPANRRAMPERRPLEVDLARGDRAGDGLPAVAGVRAHDRGARPRRRPRLRARRSATRSGRSASPATRRRRPSPRGRGRRGGARGPATAAPAAASAARRGARRRRAPAPGSARTRPGGGPGPRAPGRGRPPAARRSARRSGIRPAAGRGSLIGANVSSPAPLGGGPAMW